MAQGAFNAENALMTSYSNDEPKPDGLSGLTRFLREFGRITEQIGLAVRPGLQWIRDNEETISRFATRIGHLTGPDNWIDLEDEDERGDGAFMDLILDLILDQDGTPLAWLPPAEILGPSLSLESLEERDALYAAKSEAIVQSGRKLLQEVKRPELQQVKRAVERAWDTWESGFWEASQSLAAASLTAVLQHGGMGLPKLSNVRDALDRALRKAREGADEELGARIRELATFTLIAVSLRNDTDVRNGLPQVGFNRHLTLHGVDPKQYTPENSLRALMIATATIREVEHLRQLGLNPIVEL